MVKEFLSLSEFQYVTNIVCELVCQPESQGIKNEVIIK